MIKKQQIINAWPWLLVSLAVVIADQITKFYADMLLLLGIPYHVLPSLNFTLSYNAGVAFGFLGNFGGLQTYFLSGVSILITIIVFIWLVRTRPSEWQIALPLSLILGGAIGNLVDRIYLGYVIDFIDFYIGYWHFATFNIADSAISIGAALLILNLILSGRREEAKTNIDIQK